MRNTVTYGKDQRAKAKADGKHLVCVDALGVTFTGPVSKETASRLLTWLTENILKRTEA